MVTISLKGVLIGVLLIALIVLVIFLIVLISNLTETIKKANNILDGGTSAAAGAKATIDKIENKVKSSAEKVNGFTSTGLGMMQKIIEKRTK
ncbi:MAG: hypothetical protein GX083_00200 [Clostridiales bacterium]|nr:hypothetical protein [Clostridiales bacterium]